MWLREVGSCPVHLIENHSRVGGRVFGINSCWIQMDVMMLAG